MCTSAVGFVLVLGPHAEVKTYIYLVRLIAFLCILYAIIDKNRGLPSPPRTNENM